MFKNLALIATALLTAKAVPAGDSRVINGKEATPFSYPFVVSLQSNGNHFCGGSLLDSRTVLTAAHCTSLYSNSQVTVNVRRHDLTKSSAQEGGQSIKITRQTRHPSYNENSLTSDVAVWKLATPVTVAVSYVTLDSGSLGNQVGLQTKAIGWGRNNPNSNTLPTRLQETVLPVYDTQKCSSGYGGYINGQHHVCAGYAEGVSAVCNGDSGGPLFVNQGGSIVQVGVASFVANSKCLNPNAPSVFAKVGSYASWIRQQQQQS